MDLTNNTLSSVMTLSEIQQNFTDVATALSDLYGTDFARRAGIDKLQLANRYQDIFFALKCRSESLAAGWPGGSTVVASVPFNLAPSVIYAICQISVVCTDIGNGTGTYRIGVSNPLSAEVTYLKAASVIGSGAANVGDTFDFYSPPDEFSDYQSSNHQLERDRLDTVGELFLESTAGDAAALSAAGSFLTVTVMVRAFLRSA